MTNFIKRYRKGTVFGIVGGLVLAGGVAWDVYLLTPGHYRQRVGRQGRVAV